MLWIILLCKRVRLIFSVRVSLREVGLHVFFWQGAKHSLCEFDILRLFGFKKGVEVREVDWGRQAAISPLTREEAFEPGVVVIEDDK